MRKFISTALVALSLTGVSLGQELDKKLTERIEKAHEILHSLMATPDKSIPLDVAASAQCVVVVPAFKKGAFIFGGEYGQGVATCRTPRGWSAPVFVQMAGANFGFQIGGQSTDLVLIGRTHHSVDDLLKDKVKLGGDVSVAAGPVGRSSTAGTTELANAEFLSYSRNRGLFAGIDLAGDEVNENVKDTNAFYGKPIPYATILGGGVPTPPAAMHFEKTVAELFMKGKEQAAK
jgi:lipid-binding SYLF domain-containing protein